MSIFDAGRAMLDQIASQVSENIVLTTSSDTITVPARIGKKIFKTYDGPVPVSIMTRRFIVSAEALSTLPAKSDTVTWRGRVYRLGCPDGGPPWRYHGNDHKYIAIYASDFGTATQS